MNLPTEDELEILEIGALRPGEFPAPKTEPPEGHLERVARRLAKVTDPSFKVSAMRIGPVNTDCTIVTFTPTKGVFKSGRKKGQTRWVRGSKQNVVVYVPDREVKTETEAYEAVTGLCRMCLGERGVFSSWNYLHGTYHVKCPRCNGSGAAPEKA